MSRKTKRNQPNPSDPQAPQVSTSGAGRRSRWGTILGTVAVLALVVALGSLMFKSKGTEPTQSATDSNSAALASEHSPTLGDPNARVHIVEFLDPACETCAMFYPVVKQLLAANPGRVRVSFRHVAFHEGADHVVRLLEASRNQDKYWQTLEALLATQSQWAPHHTVRPELVGRVIAGLGLDLEQLQADMDSPEVAARVQRDRDDAMALKVTATPEYFVNGRPLPSFGQQQLLDLVDEELRRTY